MRRSLEEAQGGLTHKKAKKTLRARESTSLSLEKKDGPAERSPTRITIPRVQEEITRAKERNTCRVCSWGQGLGKETCHFLCMNKDGLFFLFLVLSVRIILLNK